MDFDYIMCTLIWCSDSTLDEVIRLWNLSDVTLELSYITLKFQMILLKLKIGPGKKAIHQYFCRTF